MNSRPASDAQVLVIALMTAVLPVSVRAPWP